MPMDVVAATMIVTDGRLLWGLFPLLVMVAHFALMADAYGQYLWNFEALFIGTLNRDPFFLDP